MIELRAALARLESPARSCWKSPHGAKRGGQVAGNRPEGRTLASSPITAMLSTRRSSGHSAAFVTGLAAA